MTQIFVRMRITLLCERYGTYNFFATLQVLHHLGIPPVIASVPIYIYSPFSSVFMIQLTQLFTDTVGKYSTALVSAYYYALKHCVLVRSVNAPSAVQKL